MDWFSFVGLACLDNYGLSLLLISCFWALTISFSKSMLLKKIFRFIFLMLVSTMLNCTCKVCGIFDPSNTFLN